MEQWGMIDSDTGTDLSALYDLLREQFQDLEDPWCKETLKWWNECVLIPSCLFSLIHGSCLSQVFPNTSDDGDERDVRDMVGPTMRERMAQERAARMAEGGSSTTNA